MAKKKGSNKSNANSVETPQRASSDDVANPVSTSEQGKSVEDMGIEELRAELMAARAEITSLKAQSDAAGKLSKPQEVQELHVKLQQLRKEQQEADAARDKAWKQLKVCHARNVPQARNVQLSACPGNSQMEVQHAVTSCVATALGCISSISKC